VSAFREGLHFDVDPASGCHVWKRYRQEKGYGRCRHGGKVRFAHRVAWEGAHGPVPPGLQLDHLCRNRACINPAHLEPVTNAENQHRGVRSPLDHADVRRIRDLPGSSYALAREFGVDASTIQRIRRGVSWGDVA
jgi:hypothetical protein